MSLEIVLRKFLLGDENEKQIREDKGIPSANQRAVNAAEEAGLCSCRRSDGIICGRTLMNPRAGFRCYPCYANYKDGKACSHG